MTKMPAARLQEDERAQAIGPEGVRHIGTTAAFATYIDAYQIADHKPLNERLLKAILDWQAEHEGVQSSNQLGWHSPRQLFQRPDPAILLLQEHIRQALTQSIRRYWGEFDPARDQVSWEAWANVNGKGAFNAPHNHSEFHFSGAYYVSLPDENGRSGAIEFFNPGGALASVMAFGQRLVRPLFRVSPKEGQLLIFPSYLRHWVYPNQDDSVRVSIAFNSRVMAQELR